MMQATRVAALRAMAQADESPNEAAIARTKLAEAGIPIDPPRPPAPPAAAPMPMPSSWWTGTGTSSTVVSSNVVWGIEIRVSFG